jgi:hypothetical protein
LSKYPYLPKIICSPSYADFRSKTNAVLLVLSNAVLLVLSQPKGRTHRSVWCAHCRGANTVNLKQQRSIWKGNLEVVKRPGRDESIWV